MHRQTKVNFVIYHSEQWKILVSNGWLTHTIDESGIATMFNFV